jgi:hypothetical protein
VPLEVFAIGLKRRNKVGGADGILFWLFEETQEKPLNTRFNSHLLILALSLGSLLSPWGTHIMPESGNSWQQ